MSKDSKPIIVKKIGLISDVPYSKPTQFGPTYEQFEQLKRNKRLGQILEEAGEIFSFDIHVPFPDVAYDLFMQLANGVTDVVLDKRSVQTEDRDMIIYTLQMYACRISFGLEMDIQYIYDLPIPEDPNKHFEFFAYFVMIVLCFCNYHDPKIMNKLVDYKPKDCDLNELHKYDDYFYHFNIDNEGRYQIKLYCLDLHQWMVARNKLESARRGKTKKHRNLVVKVGLATKKKYIRKKRTNHKRC